MAILAAASGAPAAAAPADFIHADGTRLVDGHGDRFAVKGINLGNWLVPEGYMFKFERARAPNEIAGVISALIGPEQAARFWTRIPRYLCRRGRHPFHQGGRLQHHTRAAALAAVRDARRRRRPDRFEGEGWRLVDRLVAWCRTYGLRVILDLHAAPGGQTGVNHDDGTGFPLTFYVPRYRELTIALWRALAAHYRDEPAILGYDLLNEPISPYSDENYLNPRLEPLYRDIVAAIRGVDRNHVVLLAGAQWSTSFAVFGRPFDANAVYTYHKFWAVPTRDALQSYINFSNRWNVPILIGETGEYDDDWNAQIPPPARAVRHRLVLLALQGSRFRHHRCFDQQTGRLGSDQQGRQHGRDRARRVAAARAGAGDPRRLSGSREVQERPHQPGLPRFARTRHGRCEPIAGARRAILHWAALPAAHVSAQLVVGNGHTACHGTRHAATDSGSFLIIDKTLTI